jgi:hypothetical protein
MNFIERIFGVAPDAGSGTLEVALLLVPVATGALVAFLWTRRTRRTND